MTPPATSTSSQPLAIIRGGGPTVFVTSMDRAVHFYSETLGLKIKYRAGEHFAMIDGGDGLEIGLHPAGERTPTPGAHGGIQIGLYVAQPIEEAVRTLAARGVRFDQSSGSPVIDDGAVKLAFFRDPDGNDLYLCQVMRG